MVVQTLQIGKDGHDEPRIVVIRCDHFDQQLQVILLLLERSLLEDCSDFRRLGWLNDITAGNNEVAISFLDFFFGRHILQNVLNLIE